MKSKAPKLFKFTRKSETSDDAEFNIGGPSNRFRRSTSFATDVTQVDEGNEGKAKIVFLQICARSHTEDEIDHDLINQKSDQSTELINNATGTIRSNEEFVEYLENPKKYIPGSKMIFEVLKKKNELYSTLGTTNAAIDDNTDSEVRQENSNLEELNPLLAFKLLRSRMP